MKTILVVLLLLIAASTVGYYFSPKPSLLENQTFSSAVYDRHGTLLRLTLSEDDKYRLFSKVENISAQLIEATLLYEDRYFYHHPGFNPIALLKAVWQSYVIRTRAIGASTISMQLARLLFHLNSRTIGGKLEQLLRALQLERHYSKAQILEAYLNLAPYGGNIEGVAAASLIYFAKPAADLSLPEALTLSVIPQNPTARNPSRNSGYKKMRLARVRLWNSWLKNHPQDKNQQAIMDLPLHIRNRKELPFYAPHFVNHQLTNNELIQAGSIHTTLDLSLQQQIENISQNYIEKKCPLGFHNAAVMLLDHRSMELLVSLGSVNFHDAQIQGQVNGTRAKRSPGSTLKPFVYALAMDQSLIHPMTLLKDAPKRFGAYTPENFDRGFIGPVFAKDALIHSRNVPAVNLTAQLKNPSLYDLLIQAEIAQLRSELHYGLALALGGAELTMTELVKLYAMLANRGQFQQIKRQLKQKMSTEKKQLLSPEASFLTLDILKNNPRPDSELLIQNRTEKTPVYWKTGTSFAFRDAWSIGIFGPYVLAVWVGNFNGEGNPAFVGRSAAAPLFFEIVDALSNQEHFPTDLITEVGLDLIRVDVCLPSGDLPGRHCPATEKSWFIPGKSPIRISNIYREIPINKTTDLRACGNNDRDNNIEMQVFEFWPSDILRLFRRAGISRRQPPDFDPECNLETQAASGLAPQIQSPDPSVHYALRSGQLEKEQIPFSAVSDADVKKLFWFVDHRYVGSAKSGEPFYWQAELNSSIVRVVDDHGRATVGKITVKLVQ